MKNAFITYEGPIFFYYTPMLYGTFLILFVTDIKFIWNQISCIRTVKLIKREYKVFSTFDF